MSEKNLGIQRDIRNDGGAKYERESAPITTATVRRSESLDSTNKVTNSGNRERETMAVPANKGVRWEIDGRERQRRNETITM